MGKSWSITPDQVEYANQMAEIICSEINVHEFVMELGVDSFNRRVQVKYGYDTYGDRPGKRLDIYAGTISQHKEDFAAWLFQHAILGIGV